MMRCSVPLLLALAVALANAGCAVGVAGFAAGPVASAPPPAVPPPVAYGAFLDGPAGQKLSPADKDKALAAQQEALASGQRRTWRGAGGTFGFVEPGAAGAPEADGTLCRPFTATIYFGGRPQVGHGRGCQGADGTYRMAT